MGQFIDLTGQRFGRLTVLRRDGVATAGNAAWTCACDCGNVTRVMGTSLRSGNTRSCGCLLCDARKINGKHNATHGLSGTRQYDIWLHMRERVSNPNNPAWHNYGGRGITVCERWKKSFENFWSDMGATYKPGLQLDRINNDLGYSPENCRWTTSKYNNRNRRDNRLVSSPWGLVSVAELSEKSGINQGTLLSRIRLGWPVSDLLLPSGQWGTRKKERQSQ